jgi:hypothetical protein
VDINIQIDPNTIIVGDFNTPFTDRSSRPISQQT